MKLIDFSDDSRPPSTVPPKTVAQNQITAATGLMDDDSHLDLMNEKMKDLKMHEPIQPAGHTENPLKRADTGDGEVEAFYDAE